MFKKFKILYFIIIFISLFVFTVPELDIYITTLFYNSEGFYLKNSWWVKLLYDSVPFIIISLVVVMLPLYIYNKIYKRNLLNLSTKVILFLLAVLIIGPGLIVNASFKDHFGRARPSHIIQFGGDKVFTPAYVVTDQCDKNCSFSCGHASGAFFLIALAFLATRHRDLLIALATLYGFAVGLARIAAGGHFLSDVIVSYFVVLLTTKIAYELIIKHHRFTRKYLISKFNSLRPQY